MSIRSGDTQSQRHTAAVDDDVLLATWLSPVSGIGAGLLAPWGLATLAPSMLARLLSIWSHWRNWANSTKCKRSRMPWVFQLRRRRQQVMPLPKPDPCGRTSHGISVVRTNRMPFSAARSSSRGRPLLREAGTTGSSGCNDS